MGTKTGRPDGRNPEQRQNEYKRGWENLGWDENNPPTFTNTASFKQGQTFGVWRWDTKLGWVHADLWDEAQSKRAQEAHHRKKK